MDSRKLLSLELASKTQKGRCEMKRIFLVGSLVVLFVTTAFGMELSVPFIAQSPPGNWPPPEPSTHNCGPTSVLMTAAYYLGFTPAPQHIKDLDDWTVFVGMFTSVNGYNGNNTNADQLVRLAKEYYGFQSVTKYNDGNSSIDLLRQSLGDGNPVIVGVKIDMTTTKGGHFMVLIGMTDTNVIVHDPGHSENNGGKHESYPIPQFLASWATQRYVAVVIDGSAGRSTVLGQKANGSVAPEILAAYSHNGAQQTLGTPISSIVPYSDGCVNAWPPFNDCLFQTFAGGSLGNCAIMYDVQNSPGKAFVLHGQLWTYYKNHNGSNIIIAGSPIGGPIDQEKYATDNYNDHQLAVQQMANGWLVYDTVTGFCDAVSGNSGFRLATIPGDGQTLTLLAYAQSSTSAYLTVNAITGASSYQTYQNGSYLGDLTGLALTVGSLAANTVYTFQVKAVAIDGTVLAVSNAEKITY